MSHRSDLQSFRSSRSSRSIDNCWRFEVDRILANLEFIRAFCSKDAALQMQFEENYRHVQQDVKIITGIAPKFFLDDLTDNGFVLYLRLALSYTERLVQQIKSRNRIDPDFIRIADQMPDYSAVLSDIIADLNSEQAEDVRHSRVSNCKLHVRRKAVLMNPHLYKLLGEENNDFIVAKFSSAFGFWLPDNLRRGLGLLYLIIAAGKRLPWSLSSLFSSNRYGHYILDTFLNINLDYPYNIWHLFDHPIVVSVTCFFTNFWLPVKSETLQLPKQARFRLDYRGNLLDFYRMTDEEIAAYASDKHEQERQNAPGLRHRNHETIRCRYSYITSKAKIIESWQRIKSGVRCAPKALKCRTVRRYPEGSDEINNNWNPNETRDFSDRSSCSKDFRPNPDGKLVLFLHGGAFFTMGSRSSEMFLCRVAEKLAGIPILAVDYSLTVPYPIPMQEVMDVYLWLLSGQDEVKRKLGFHPKKIILAGDSVGAFFSLALTIVLNELNKMQSKCSEQNGHAARFVPLPISILGAYGVLSFSKIFPSLVFDAVDLLVEPRLVMLVVAMYGANVWCHGDFKRIENDDRFRRIVAKNRDEFVDGQAHGNGRETDDSRPWFDCDFGTYMSRAEYISSFYEHPFIEPLLYEAQFDQLKGVDLYCCVGNNDPTLDCNIDLARMWKGKAVIDVFEQLTHAFLQLAGISAEASEAIDIFAERLQEASGLISDRADSFK